MPESRQGAGFRGGELLRFGTVASTMDTARSQPPSTNSVTVLASNQTAGRGRYDRTWASPPSGGLYLTVRIPWTRPIQQAPLVSIAAAIALAKVSHEQGCRDIVLKWPNDLLIGGRKAAGILAEMASSPDGSFLLVGVGINVSIHADVLSRVGQPATSLSDACGSALDPEQILSAFLAHWSLLDTTLELEGFTPLAKEFRRFTDLPGRRFRLSSGESMVDVEVRDIRDDGSLEVQYLSTGEIGPVYGGELLPLGAN
jgi:BirA family transcriptional regulator, biotin operon repressor / biotin---[acetyl-CoA-carboxylase] ligase